MRLLNATTLALEEFHGADIPPYAILSHTWGKDEVLFTDITNGLFDSRQKHGFKKIEHCANQTRADGLSYCWIDTCSINKSSSAELSEAINSMFTWYSKAEKCYAYLEDVSSESVLDEFDYGPLLSFNSDRARVIDRWVGAISNSRWITRGWTLQELIAPVDVFFYSQDWRPMGSKKKWSHYLAAVTGIDQNVLRYSDFRNVSIAERMSWAARRSTTRLEDEAYCLMGIFEVNMPLLYGEGEKAFTRLQEEIIKSSDDQSIFAWTAVGKSRTSFRGLLARSPLEFRDCQDIKFLRSMEGEPFSMTNRGLRISLLCSVRMTDPPELLGLLNCTKDTRQLAINLACLSEPGKTDQYARVDPGHITHIRREKTAAFTHMQLLYIRNTFHSLPNFKTNRISGFSLGEFESTFYMCSAWPDNIMLSDNMNYYFVDNPMPAFDGIHTARIMWHSNVGWQPFLFEFQFNDSSCVVRQPPGLGKLLLSDSLPPYGFQGVLCRMKPTYEISQVPMLNDVVTDGGFPAGRELQLGLVVVQDEVMIAATGALMNTLRETDHLRT